MKAMVLREYGQPLQMDYVTIPQIGRKEVLVRVEACGICGTDLKISSGNLPGTRVPLIMGHEPAGTVVDVGSETTGLAPGDRVCIHFYVTCGKCHYCKTGHESLCTNLIGQVGFHLNGGFADYLVVPAENCLKIPLEVPFEQAAILGDAVATTYHAIFNRADVTPKQTVLIMGAGGVGLHAIQIAKLAGAYPIAVDISEEKLDFAKKLGADTVICSKEVDYYNEVKTQFNGIDVIIETVGTPTTLQANIGLLKRGGKMVIIGYKPGYTFTSDPLYFVNNEISVLGSRASNKEELKKVIELVASGKIKPIVSKTFALTEVNDALAVLKKGKIIGRAIIRP